MYQINFNEPIHIHFIGIGGISMSGLAKLLKSHGFTISGSDWHSSDLTKELESLGIQVFIGQHKENITNDIDLVVYTAAVKENNEEYLAAKEASIPLMPRSVLLGQIMKQYPHAVGIAGTHGKTTTTSLLSALLLAGDLDPTISVGGVLNLIGGNLRIGHSDYFVAEACEYTNTFLSLYPTDAIILNIEEDHLDFFKDLEEIRQSFAKYIALVPEHGTVYINGEIEDYQTLCSKAVCHVESYGILENEISLTNPISPYTYSATNIVYDNSGCGSFDFIANNQYLGRIQLGLIGRHNISNALPTIALALNYGVSMETIQATLPKFHGTKRRFEYKGTKNGVLIYDDYAHHPTEIRGTLTSAKQCKHNRIITVFQPHTYSRTKLLFNEFSHAFDNADLVILTDIYAAREIDDGSISSKMLADELLKNGINAVYISSFDDIAKKINEVIETGDIVLTIGAGTITKLSDLL